MTQEEGLYFNQTSDSEEPKSDQCCIWVTFCLIKWPWQEQMQSNRGGGGGGRGGQRSTLLTIEEVGGISVPWSSLTHNNICSEFTLFMKHFTQQELQEEDKTAQQQAAPSVKFSTENWEKRRVFKYLHWFFLREQQKHIDRRTIGAAVSIKIWDHIRGLSWEIKP